MALQQISTTFHPFNSSPFQCGVPVAAGARSATLRLMTGGKEGRMQASGSAMVADSIQKVVSLRMVLWKGTGT